MSPYELIASLDEQIIQQKAELTYWKETSEYYQNKLKEIQKILNKTFDKENTK